MIAWLSEWLRWMQLERMAAADRRRRLKVRIK